MYIDIVTFLLLLNTTKNDYYLQILQNFRQTSLYSFSVLHTATISSHCDFLLNSQLLISSYFRFFALLSLSV